MKKVFEKKSFFFSASLIILSLIKVGFFDAGVAKALDIPDEEKWTDYDNFVVIDTDTTWRGNIVYNNLDKPVVIVNGANLTIEKGTHIEILNLEVNMGRIIAEGTKDEKIIFTKATPAPSEYGIKTNCVRGERGLIKFADNAWISEYSTEPSIFRYVEFNNMGSYDYVDQEECACPYEDENCQAMNHNIFRRLFNTAWAAESLERINPALKFEYGNLHIENSSFKNNSYADVEVSVRYYSGEPMSRLEIVNSNFEGNKQKNALISSAKKYSENEDPVSEKSKVILKNNWYGHLQGPTEKNDSPEKGEKISGDYTLDGFRNSNLISDPAIIIPGIMGSAEVAGKLIMDPILHTYDNLINSLDQNGYQKNINLFEFPYEWRDSNVITAGLLKQKIQDVKNSTGVSKVDLVAHSMGGLIARYYIEGDDYQDDVDQLITLGTPHRGSPKGYLYLEAGEGFFSRAEQLAKELFKVEARHAGYSDLEKYIQDKVKSVGELLPDYDYLQKVSDGEMKNYPDDYPDNSLLEFLNGKERVKRMSGVNFVNMVGNLDSEKTIKKFRVAETLKEGKWKHGMPENFYDDTTDRGIEYGKGDETVPLFSSTGINSRKMEEIKATHLQLPSRAQCKVLAELTNKSEKNCSYIKDTAEIVSILTFGILSPIDIQVIDPNGKKVGKNFETGGIINQIEGAYYSGSGTENEFLVIPNPEDGEYKIIAEGTGDGEYEIDATKIVEDASSGEAGESTQKIIGTAVKGEQEEKTLTITKEEKTDDNIVSSVAGLETVSNDNFDNENDDSENDTKKEETDSNSNIESFLEDQTLENNNVFENIRENINEDVLGIKYDPQDLPKRNEENKKFTNIVTFVFILVAIFCVIFLVSRSRVDKKV
ncbi:MAG: hypothetical protein WC906_00365 [Parcubacteria group bacterium]|jgi:pimeloyl-ACP methyl ester carboxylesterase